MMTLPAVAAAAGELAGPHGGVAATASTRGDCRAERLVEACRRCLSRGTAAALAVWCAVT